VHGIYLIRHCRAEGQESFAPLTDEGHRQSELLAALIARTGISRIVASPYKRAIDSATPLAKMLAVPVHTDERLIERVLSDPPLVNWREHLHGTFIHPDFALPGGESSMKAMARGRAAVDAAVSGAAGRVAIVTHGNLLTLILQSLTGRGDFEVWEKLTTPDVFLVHSGGVAVRVWSHHLV
jgi:2,3-bisphosphoglycerate-dependent phosphoglycerate mutase